MRRRDFLLLLFLAGCSSTSVLSPPRALPVSAAAGRVGMLVWDPNPASQGVTAYQVYKLVGQTATLVATVAQTQYRPAQTGKYFVKAVSPYGISPPSETKKL